MRKIIFVLSLLTFNCSLLNAQGWVIQFSQSGYNFKSLSSLSNGTVYVLGDNYNSGQIFKTTNYGVNWITNISILQGQSYFLEFINQNNGFCSDAWGFKKTTNAGVNWQTYTFSPFDGLCYDVSFINENTGWVSILTNPFGGNDLGCIAKTTNSGANWQEYPVFSYLWPFSVTFLDSLLGYVAGGLDNNSSGIIFKTTTGGNTFEQLGEYSLGIKKVFFVNVSTGWVIAGNGVIKKTTNGGTNWLAQNSGVSVQLNSCWFANLQTGYVCGQNGKIIYTTNSGNNWIQEFSSVTSNLNELSFINSTTGWIVTDDGKILYTNNGGISNITHGNQNIPDNFSLLQNYPNPFNPSTKIKIDIPSVRVGQTFLSVILKIYDITGKEIQTLVNETLKPGSYEVTFDGSNLPSGVYFYKLTAGNYNEARKMILLK